MQMNKNERFRLAIASLWTKVHAGLEHDLEEYGCIVFLTNTRKDAVRGGIESIFTSIGKEAAFNLSRMTAFCKDRQ